MITYTNDFKSPFSKKLYYFHINLQTVRRHEALPIGFRKIIKFRSIHSFRATYKKVCGQSNYQTCLCLMPNQLTPPYTNVSARWTTRLISIRGAWLLPCHRFHQTLSGKERWSWIQKTILSDELNCPQPIPGTFSPYKNLRQSTCLIDLCGEEATRSFVSITLGKIHGTFLLNTKQPVNRSHYHYYQSRISAPTLSRSLGPASKTYHLCYSNTGKSSPHLDWIQQKRKKYQTNQYFTELRRNPKKLILNAYIKFVATEQLHLFLTNYCFNLPLLTTAKINQHHCPIKFFFRILVNVRLSHKSVSSYIPIDSLHSPKIQSNELDYLLILHEFFKSEVHYKVGLILTNMQLTLRNFKITQFINSK